MVAENAAIPKTFLVGSTQIMEVAVKKSGSNPRRYPISLPVMTDYIVLIIIISILVPKQAKTILAENILQ